MERDIDTLYSKCVDSSLIYRQQGNEYYEKGEFIEAIEAYTMAIIHAPEHSIEHALAIANRSAAAAKLEDWPSCIADCQLALHQEATPVKSLEKINKRLRHAEESIIEKCKGDEVWSIYAPDEQTKLAGGKNEISSALSSLVRLIFKQAYGRMVVAKEAIMQGDCILVERPLCVSVHKQMRKHLCNNCSALLSFACHVCPECIHDDIRFCSDECVMEARATYHKFECQFYTSFPSGNNEEEMKEIIALRILSMTPLQELYEFMPKLNLPDSDSWSAINVGRWGTKSMQEKIGRNVRSLLSLYGHGEATRNISDAAVTCLMQLVKFIKPWPSILPAPSKRYEFMLNCMRAILARLDCNAHAIQPMLPAQLDERLRKSIIATLPSNVAMGIYPVQSLFNHSCVPNVIPTYSGSLVHVRTIRNLRKGEELVTCYGPRFGMQSRDERRDKLNYQYNFWCGCLACVHDKYIHTERMQSVRKCGQCSNDLEASDEHCSKCGQVAAVSSHDVQDLTTNMKTDIDALMNLQNVTPAHFETISKQISELQLHVHVVNKLLHDVRLNLADACMYVQSYTLASRLYKQCSQYTETVFGAQSEEHCLQLFQEALALLTVAEHQPYGQKRDSDFEECGSRCAALFQFHRGKHSARALIDMKFGEHARRFFDRLIVTAAKKARYKISKDGSID